MAKTAPITGTSDMFADEINAWRLLEDRARSVFTRYGYGELRTPVFERTDVFTRSLGDETDVVQKEMYTFEDRGGRSLTLRPEGTAGVMRALVNQGIPQGDERRVFYMGPMFRGERPAAGRKRQFHQVGVEAVGKMAPGIDSECIAMLMHYLEEIDLSKIRLLLNSRGATSDREPLANAFRTYFSDYTRDMCEDCQRRLTTNVNRIMDCKADGCRTIIDGAPSVLELLSAESADYFAEVCAGLDSMGIAYEIDPRLVRGLDYYVHTVFEVVFKGIGAQNALAGGGRYEITFPGQKQPVRGVGFAAGMERLLLAREACGHPAPAPPTADAYLVSLGTPAFSANQILAAHLRRAGLRVGMDLEKRGMKPQMRAAGKSGAPHVIIRGDQEIESGIVIVKDMASGEQQSIAADSVLETLVAK